MIKNKHNFIAVDLGASNVRIILGRFHGSEDVLKTQEVYRFAHKIIEKSGLKLWDWGFITSEIKKGLCDACELTGDETIDSICCDSWAQDFGLINEYGRLFYPPVSYRDKRTNGIADEVKKIINQNKFYNQSGSGPNDITTLSQLRAMMKTEPETLKKAKKLLNVAGLINNMLCGSESTDWTFATVSQAYDIRNDCWNSQLLKKLGIPRDIFPEIVKHPAIVGRITENAAPHPKLKGVPIISGAGHDTAVASLVLGESRGTTLFASLGTWSMICCIADEHDRIFSSKNRAVSIMGFPFGKLGMFHSSMGMWIFQACQNEWEKKGVNIAYDDLNTNLEHMPINSLVDINNKRFFCPESMTGEIIAACAENGAKIPVNPLEFSKVIFDSLALSIRHSVEKLQRASGLEFKRIHLLSGGCQNPYLCRKIASELNMPAIAGPAEASATGNLLLQAKTLNTIKNEKHLMEVLENSFKPVVYEV